MLGSSFVSDQCRQFTLRPAEAMAPIFPNITIRDIVAAQKAFLDHLWRPSSGPVAGPSYGGYQAFQWGVAYPDFIYAIVPGQPAPWPRSTHTDNNWPNCSAAFARSRWHGGRYYCVKAACKRG